MGRFLKRVSQDVHQVYGCDNGMCFKLRRVKSADLITRGVAELIGGADALAALSDVQDEQRRATDADTPEAREKRAKIEAHAAQSKIRKMQVAIASDPERLKEFAQRIDAFFCASVVAAGEWDGGEDRIIAESEAHYLDSVSFVMESGHADHDQGRMWVIDIAEGVRQVVAGAAQSLTSARAAVRPFREVPRDAADVA